MERHYAPITIGYAVFHDDWDKFYARPDWSAKKGPKQRVSTNKVSGALYEGLLTSTRIRMYLQACSVYDVSSWLVRTKRTGAVDIWVLRRLLDMAADITKDKGSAQKEVDRWTQRHSTDTAGMTSA